MREGDFYLHPKFGRLKYLGCPNGKLIFHSIIKQDDGKWHLERSVIELDAGIFNAMVKRGAIQSILSPV